jgi:hypothetical protein
LEAQIRLEILSNLTNQALETDRPVEQGAGKGDRMTTTRYVSGHVQVGDASAENLPNHSRQLADQELGRFLVPTNLSERHSSGTVTVRLLDTTSGRRRLASGLGGELFAGCLSTGRLAGSLLGTGHFERV